LTVPTRQMLEVPGARLYYEVRGSGPVLLFVGHPMTSDGFAPIVPAFVDRYTVVTFDPRGFGRSTIENTDQDAEPDLLADDARHVLDQVSDAPAYVFGSSGGAITGLALVARHPERVRTLVAHDPPVALLLPEAEEARAAFQVMYDTYRASGIGPAWQAFMSFTSLAAPAPDANPVPPTPEMVATSQRFFEHGLLPIALYQPDISALQAGPARVIVGGGTTSRGQFAQRSAAALAERLGTPLLDFPGGHTGFASNPAEFAPILQRALA